MKCPKCGYLGFERVDRCRNCGYDFSLAPQSEAFELPLKEPSTTETEPRRLLSDMSFLDEAMAAVREPDSAAPADRTSTWDPNAAQPGPSPELPLFGPPIPDDEPLITKASPPRPPLAVRRATPDVPRLRTVGGVRPASFDFGAEPPERPRTLDALDASLGEAEPAFPDASEDADVFTRFAAVVADLLILAAIDAVVVYFTLQICGIGLEDLDLLPRGPLLAFLIVQNGGYLVTFTAGGQTLGKLAMGIRVVPVEPGSLDLGRAFLRELLWFLLAVPAGLGFLTILNRDHRGIHDRFAGTRVVRAAL
jgi:uncharacterized RDD family membrane protein YckC